MLKSANVCRTYSRVSNLLEMEVYERRKVKNFSQEKLAAAIDVSRNCIQQLECHEHLPMLSTLFKLTRALEFSDEEYMDFMLRLRDAYEADIAFQKELAENAV